MRQRLRNTLLAVFLLSGLGCATGAGRDSGPTNDSKGTQMHKMQFDVKGSGGTPLVLVGGGLTGWESWIPHQEELATSRKVARAQLMSVQYGLENRDLPPGYSMNMESDALAAAIADVTDGPIDLAAWSYGAFVALDYALDHPERIRTLTLIEPPAFWVLDATGRMDPQARAESDEVRALFGEMTEDVTEEQLAKFLAAAGLLPPGTAPEDLPPWPNWVKHRRSLRTGDAEWVHTDTADRLRSFPKPVLLVKGTGSSHFLHTIISALDETLPNASLIELPGGHAPHIVSRSDFLTRLSTFQSEQAQ